MGLAMRVDLNFSRRLPVPRLRTFHRTAQTFAKGKMETYALQRTMLLFDSLRGSSLSNRH
jgi:hypothetical protein